MSADRELGSVSPAATVSPATPERSRRATPMLWRSAPFYLAGFVLVVLAISELWATGWGAAGVLLIGLILFIVAIAVEERGYKERLP